jgi:phosphatidylglycerol:prolipoprotein diacylglycerol transferase
VREHIIAISSEAVARNWLNPDPRLLWIFSLLIVLAISVRSGYRQGLSPRIMACAGIWGMLGAQWGGHWLFLLAAPKLLKEDPLLLIRFMEGEKGIFGALFGACVFGWLYLRRKKVSFLAYADAATPAIALGYSVARIGCFLNGCCFGTVSDVSWAVRFPRGTLAFTSHLEKGWVHVHDALSLPVHPTQLYHAAVGLALYLILRKWDGRWKGSRLAFGLAGYGSMRFLLQCVRGDASPVLGALDVNQLLSVAALLAAGLLWWFRGRAKRRVKDFIPSTGPNLPFYREWI